MGGGKEDEDPRVLPRRMEAALGRLEHVSDVRAPRDADPEADDSASRKGHVVV